MPQRHFYKPGSFLRVCDVSGFTVRAEYTAKQWNNYIVRKDFWEPRNAQDFVRGRRDEQASPDPRPRQLPFGFSGENTTLSQNAPIRAAAIFLTAPIGLQIGNTISIMLDSASVFYAQVVSIGGDFSPDFSPDFSLISLIGISSPLPFHAKAGNAVVNLDFVAVTQQSYPKAS
jgi:hypothetical protein